MVVRCLGQEGVLRVGFVGLLSSGGDLAMKVMRFFFSLSPSKVRSHCKEIRSPYHA
jgi:hypothetical protein